MIGDLAKEANAQNTRSEPIQSRAYISLNNELLKDGDNPSNNKDIRATNFVYYIKYKPSYLTKYKTKPFVLVSDVIYGGKIRFNSFNFLKEVAKRDKSVKWLLDNCDFDPYLLAVAKCNYDMVIYVPFNAGKYRRKLVKQQDYQTRRLYQDKCYSYFKEPSVTMAERELSLQMRAYHNQAALTDEERKKYAND